MSNVATYIIDGKIEAQRNQTTIPSIGDHVEIGSSDPLKHKVVVVIGRIWKKPVDDFYQRCDLICEVVKTPTKRSKK